MQWTQRNKRNNIRLCRIFFFLGSCAEGDEPRRRMAKESRRGACEIEDPICM